MKSIYALVWVILFSGCMYPKGMYQLNLNAVEFHNEQIILFDSTSTSLEYQDQYISITWKPSMFDYGLKLANKSGEVIKINWDDVVYIDENQEAHRVVHSEVRLINSDRPQVPTTIPRDSYIEDFIVPSHKAQYPTPNYRTIFPVYGAESEGYRSVLIGKHVKIRLPIQIDDTKLDYLFDFKITGFKKSAYRTPYEY